VYHRLDIYIIKVELGNAILYHFTLFFTRN